jgi:hypothetical protein
LLPPFSSLALSFEKTSLLSYSDHVGRFSWLHLQPSLITPIIVAERLWISKKMPTLPVLPIYDGGY